MRTINYFTTVIFLTVLAYSCVGPKGEDGLDGRDANVKVAIYDIEPEKWAGNFDGYVTTLNVPELTNNIYYNGAVLVYMLRNENNANRSFNQLPYTWLNNQFSEYVDFEAFIGEIDITIRWVDYGKNNTEAPTGLYTFKVLVVEGMTLSALKAKTDISDHNSVMTYLSAQASF
jgi:hypothetical protein